MDEKKKEFLDWLLKPRAKDYPFVTYRGSAVKAELNFVIPFDEISKFFGVDQLVIRGKTWERNPDAPSR